MADVCTGCGNVMDPVFDSGLRDARGLVWHSGCYAKSVSEPSNGRALLEIAIWLVCWPLGLARLVGRSRGWRTSSANQVGVGASLALVLVVGVVTVLTTASSSPPAPSPPARTAPSPAATYALSDLQKILRPELESYLTTYAPSGVAGHIASVFCEHLAGDDERFKCGARGELFDSNTGMAEKGHMTILVTPGEDGQYGWEATGDGWTADQ